MNSTVDDSSGNHVRKRRLEWWKSAPLWATVAATVGALAGGPGYRAFDDPRQHPYTSKDAAANGREVKYELRQESGKLRDDMLHMSKTNAERIADFVTKIEARLDRMDMRDNSLNERVSNLPPDTLLERVTRNEVRLENLERTALRIYHPKAKRQMGAAK